MIKKIPLSLAIILGINSFYALPTFAESENAKAQESQGEEQSTALAQKCKETNGTWDEENKKCQCPNDTETDENNECKTIDTEETETKKTEKKNNNNKNDSNKKNSTDKSENENKSKPEKKLSDADQQKKIDELRDNADAMHEREKSTANKMLGGAAMATMGMSGMEMASAMSEKKAMADAELDMSAYLATFVCDYGAGRNIKGGEVDVELPSSPELSTIKAEYIALATDLKERKAALDMQPGIESELILDAATTGLYDNESLGKTDGVYTSVSRTLLDENGTDAAEWNAEKERIDKKIKNSTTALAVGAVASIAGNAIINADAPKEQSDKINKKYETLKQAANADTPKEQSNKNQ